MESVQKWGNRRCNLYWEAHLKAGHVPADHKIESFIRSKYESRRWAKDGPPPADPSVLDGGESAPAAPAAAVAAVGTSTVEVPKKAAPKVNLFDDDEPAPTPHQHQHRQPRPRSRHHQQRHQNRQEEESSISTGTNPPHHHHHHHQPNHRGEGQERHHVSLCRLIQTCCTLGWGWVWRLLHPAPASSVSGLQSSFGGLDLSSSSAAVAKSTTTPAYGGAASNPWSTGTSTTSAAGGAGGLFDTHDVWGSGGTSTTTSATTAKPKDDAFADIWGDFK